MSTIPLEKILIYNECCPHAWKNIFDGSIEDWNALSTAEKIAYDHAMINNDYVDNPVGNLNALTTTDKSSCVGAINEVNFVAGTLYYSIIATDTKDFITKLVTRIDTDIASKPGYIVYNVYALHLGVQEFFGMVVRQNIHGYNFYFSTSGNKQYQGTVDIPSETVVVYEYTGTQL